MFTFVNDSTFRASILPQIVEELTCHGKWTESGGLHGQSIRSAAVSFRWHIGGRTFTLLEVVCSKSGINPAGVDGKVVDGISGFTVEKLAEYLREVKPEWFPAKVRNAGNTRQNIAENVLADLGL